MSSPETWPKGTSRHSRRSVNFRAGACVYLSVSWTHPKARTRDGLALASWERPVKPQLCLSSPSKRICRLEWWKKSSIDACQQFLVITRKENVDIFHHPFPPHHLPGKAFYLTVCNVFICLCARTWNGDEEGEKALESNERYDTDDHASHEANVTAMKSRPGDTARRTMM